MNHPQQQAIRAYLIKTLQKHGDDKPLDNAESLFLSGRLDSLSMVMLVSHLEQEFGLAFSAMDFDIALLDSVNAITTLLEQRHA